MTLVWPDRIIRANNAKPSLRKHPDSIRQKVEGALKVCRRLHSNSPEVNKAIDIFLCNQVQKLLDGETLLEVSSEQIVQIIDLRVTMTKD